MIRRNGLLMAGAAALAVLAVPQMASAHVSVCVCGAGSGLLSTAAAGVLSAAAPVYYGAPAPVYYGPPPVVVDPGWYRWGPRYRYYDGYHWRRWR